MIRYTIPYRGYNIECLQGCEAVVVTLATPSFEWDIFCKSVRSAKLHISRHIKQQQGE